MEVDQILIWIKPLCDQHPVVMFRRYVGDDHAEVMTCSGSRTVKITDLEV